MNRAGEEILRTEAVGKTFPPATIALAAVDFTLRSGEVLALIGENGAGKSTLSRILAGIVKPDSGRLVLKGQDFAPRSRRDAEAQGIRMVMQELNLIPTLTVAESIFLDRLPHRWGWIDQKALHRNAREILERVGLPDLDPGVRVGSLGVGQQQLIEIATGLAIRGEVLILDEPTAALTDQEVDRLFAQIEKLKSEGVGVVYISHRMQEIRRIADRVMVLRDGRVRGERDAKAVEYGELIQLMVGRALALDSFEGDGPSKERALRVDDLCVGEFVRGVSFEVHRGEILGFAGLMGAGRTETMRGIFGADPMTSGALYLGGSETPVRINTPHEAVASGMAFVTENRKEEGLFLPLSVEHNVSITRMSALAWGRSWLRRKEEARQTEEQVQALKIRCGARDQRVEELSGGNQQKVVIAKWLTCEAEVLIFDEPTRGIDIGAKFEIYGLLHQLAAQGKAILLVSSELSELMLLSHRIAVMSRGHLVEMVDRSEFDENRIMAAALHHHLGAELSNGGGENSYCVSEQS